MNGTKTVIIEEDYDALGDALDDGSGFFWDWYKLNG